MPRSASRSVERGGEQHRQRGLVELHALPVRRAAEPLVLVPVAVLVLRRDQVAQRVARLRLGAERQQRAGAFDEIARPDQVIAAALVAGMAPGHAEARDHRAGIGLVEMRCAARSPRSRACSRIACGRSSIEHGVLGAAGLPALPIGDLLLQHVLERLHQARDRQGRGRLRRCCRSRAPAPPGAAIRPSARHCPARRSGTARSSRRCARNPASRRCCRHSRRWRGRRRRADARRPRRAPCRTAPARPSARGASDSVRRSRRCRSRSPRDAARRST